MSRSGSSGSRSRDDCAEAAKVATGGIILDNRIESSEAMVVSGDGKVAGVVEYLAFDLETTGLSPRTDRVVEFGGVRFASDGCELGRYEQLVNPKRPMSPSAQLVNGLSDAMLAGQPPARDVLPRFLAFLGDPAETTLLAHNASFDASFLGQEIARLRLPPLAHSVVDTLALARSRLPHLRNHRLDTLARLFDLDPTAPHRALADSLRVKGLWLALNGQGPLPQDNVAYRVEPDSRPTGWETIEQAIDQGLRVRIEYSGGTRGSGPREITPRYFDQHGGVAYLVAFCHIDALEKTFRLDRVLRYEVLPSSPTTAHTSRAQ
jgi:DNA polymerase III epsilon subunit family exonuclease